VETSLETTEIDASPWPDVNHGLKKVILGGVGLAELRYNNYHFDVLKQAPVLMNPHAQVSDEIFLTPRMQHSGDFARKPLGNGSL
jgi:hypothetical protein